MNDLFTIERFCYAPTATFGRLFIPTAHDHDPPLEGFRCFTCENPWMDNVPYLSCIPCGVYRVTYGRYHRRNYPAWELHDVPGRTLIKIHRGNTADDVLGCIVVGKSLGYVDDQWAVTSSAERYDDFMVAMERFGKEARVEIRNQPINIGCLPDAVRITQLRADGVYTSTLDLSPEKAKPRVGDPTEPSG